MKICDMVQAYARNSGGVKTYLDEKRRFVLDHTDHEHVLIVPGAVDRVVEEGRAVTYEITSPMVRGAGAYRFIGRVDKLLRILGRESPDVVEVGDPYLMPWVARYHRWRRGVPVVGFYHTDFPRAYGRRYVERVAGETLGRASEWIGDVYARTVYRDCAAVVASSAELHEALTRVGVRENLHHIPLGVDLDGFHPRHRDRSVWEQHGVARDSVILVYAGRLDTEKHVDRLVETFRDAGLPEQVSLVCIGEGPLRTWIESLAHEDSRIRVIPYVSDRARLGRLLASADLYVTAGPHETFALSVIEAQASGLGVVGVAAGALVDRVTPQTGVLAAPDDPADFARALREGLRRDRNRLGREARRVVEQQFSWGVTFERLLELYRHVGASDTRPATLGGDAQCVP
ncbi:MAG TPA: glycosyltransferase [Candidatus Krumholzibacteria bacterium]|nr:glycosyltransferase [Candidatus Krumholzibacteria bacterium]